MTPVYKSVASLDLFEDPGCTLLATQIWPGRYFTQLAACSDTASNHTVSAHLRLLEDGYTGYMPLAVLSDATRTVSAPIPPAVEPLAATAIGTRLQLALNYAEAATHQANCYLWGGTVGPNFDCSGLVQRSFAAAGIWLPRDSYQQADFCDCLFTGVPTAADLTRWRAGDLIFFQFGRRVDHVAIYWGDGRYLHSSGPERGRNGLAWDRILPTAGDAIANRYRQHVCQVGRIHQSLPFPASL